MSTWFENSITRDCDVVRRWNLAGFVEQSELNRSRMVSASVETFSMPKQADSDFLCLSFRIFFELFSKTHHSIARLTPRIFLYFGAIPPSCRSAVRLWTEFPTEFSLKKWQPNSESDFVELRIRKRRTENQKTPNWESPAAELRIRNRRTGKSDMLRLRTSANLDFDNVLTRNRASYLLKNEHNVFGNLSTH